jgi:hypothetical protein
MRQSNNERVAKKILDVINNWELDEHSIGEYIARLAPLNLFTRFQLMANSAILERNRIVETDHVPDIGDDDFVQQNGGSR